MIKSLLVLALVHSVLNFQDIRQFGAVQNTDNLFAQQKNQKAITLAIQQANSAQSQGNQRIVVIPEHRYYSLPIVIDKVQNIVIEVRGKLVACNRIKHWPKNQKENGISYWDFIAIRNSKNITINGGGKIDGRGYIWWLNSWLVTKKYLPAHSSRPHLITANYVQGFTVHDLVLKNSPCFHLATGQTLNATFYNLDIKVNTTAQWDILKRNYLNGIVPLFPLNTDGIDPAGKNFHIYNITCQNYDDVIVPKPTHISQGSLTNCTQDMLIENITVRLGVGLSIGSVPPNSNTNCVKNIIFRNAHFEKPFKGIYIKTNPGNSGNGIIHNILYENITMHQPIWWAIYLGPQQQKQPDRGGPGCMLYPFDPKGTCQTQPRINITNITLRNVVVRNSLLFPIILRCNQTNPCVTVNFDNVQARGWLIGKKDKGYVCQNVKGTMINSYPKLSCLTDLKGNLVSEYDQEPIEQDQQKIEESQQILSPELVLKKMKEAAEQFPYQDEADEMFLSEAEIRQDEECFKQNLIETSEI